MPANSYDTPGDNTNEDGTSRNDTRHLQQKVKGMNRQNIWEV